MKCLGTKAQIVPVVCTTRVGLHYKAIKPTLLKGKYVYCEWLLASKVKVAEELHAVVKEKQDPDNYWPTGRAVSSDAEDQTLDRARQQSRKCHKQLRRCSGGIRMGDRMIEGLKYFTRKAVVANFVTSPIWSTS